MITFLTKKSNEVFKRILPKDVILEVCEIIISLGLWLCGQP